MSSFIYAVDETHDVSLRSWIASANKLGGDFPIQNLPFSRYRRQASTERFRIGVAIGDQILDLRATGLTDIDDMNELMSSSLSYRRDLRHNISRGLRIGSELQRAWSELLLPQLDAEYILPCHIGDYTDFYTGIHHAIAVGKLFRPENPLLPNYKWVPIGYHGRSSSIRVSGQTFRRPTGQTMASDAEQPNFGSTKRLDYELELGYLVGQGNELGQLIGIDDAEKHLFGVTLLNDWSARDIQAWEYQPLGPFLAKNFATTISPWIVTMEALAPFRLPFSHPESDPQPLPYLQGQANKKYGALDISLEVLLMTKRMREEGLIAERLSHSNCAQAAYWTPAQLITHHTVNGCNLQSGDMLGSGTLSGPSSEQAGSLLELTFGGKNPIKLTNGEVRTFIEDGDTVVFRGWCERSGAVRIGFGDVHGTVAVES